jgi:hypothetical protein
LPADRLDPGRYPPHRPRADRRALPGGELQPGAAPSGATELADFNTADLVARYGPTLARLMRQQFPAIHDPSHPAHAMALPPLARRPLDRQRQLIAARLKLLALGENPGCRGARRGGSGASAGRGSSPVGTARSTVTLSIAGALAPLHLPRHRVVVLERLSDLDRDAEI